MAILYTSLAEIKSFSPCLLGWRDILKGQGKTIADTELFPLTDCLKSNSFSDVCWLIGKRNKEVTILVRAAQKCADSVKSLSKVPSVANDAAIYAADAAANAANAANAARAAANAAQAAIYAAHAAIYAANADDAARAAQAAQENKNKQLLTEAIQEFESAN